MHSRRNTKYQRTGSFSKYDYDDDGKKLSYPRTVVYVIMFFVVIVVLCLAPHAFSSGSDQKMRFDTPRGRPSKTSAIPAVVHYENFPDINMYDVHEKALALLKSQEAFKNEEDEEEPRKEEETVANSEDHQFQNDLTIKQQRAPQNGPNDPVGGNEQHPVALSRDELIKQSLTEAKFLIHELSVMKYDKKIVMEFDQFAQERIRFAQSSIRKYLTLKYGPGPYYVKMTLGFPDSMMNEASTGGLKATVVAASSREEEIVIELAPIDYVPYSVFMFLEYIVSGFKSGAFHRNAGHVLQAMVTVQDENDHVIHERFAWQEYSPHYPHKKYTLGYAGRPSSNGAFYISTVDNVRNHGPASQGSKSEADSIIGRIFSGEDVVHRMCKQPNKGSNGFIQSPADYIKILSLDLISK